MKQLKSKYLSNTFVAWDVMDLVRKIMASPNDMACTTILMT